MHLGGDLGKSEYIVGTRRAEMTKLRILMIEDNQVDARLAERHLLKMGVRFESVVVDSWEGLERALLEEWDVVLSDYHLPGMDFETLLAHVRFVCSHVPVIVLSGGIDLERAVELLKMGVTDFVAKDRRSRLVPAIDRALREREVERDRRMARREAERFASFPKLNPNPVLETDLDGQVTFCNETTLRLVESLGLAGPAAFLPPELPELLFFLGMNGEPVTRREVAVGGRIFAAVIHFAARFGTARIYAQDVTALKDTGRALRDSEARLRLGLDAARAASWEWDVRAHRRFGDADVPALAGMALDTPRLFSERWSDIVHPADLPLVEETVQEALRERAEFELEFRGHGAASRARWLLIRGRPVTDWEGRVERYLGVVIDVTEMVELRRVGERHQERLEAQVAQRTAELRDAEARLRRQNAALVHAQHIASIGSWEWDRATGRLDWSAELYCMAGRNPGLPAPRRDELAALLAPGDWPRLQEAGRRLRQDGLAYELDLEMLRPDGERRWIAARGEPRRDGAGVLTGLCGTVLDITARKRMEATVAEQSARLAALSRRLLDVQEEERRRLANLVYDSLSPNLATLRIGLQLLMEQLPVRLAKKLQGQTDDLQAILRDTLEDARDLSADLRPVVLDLAGLLPALEDYAQQFTRRTGLAIRVRGQECGERLPPARESALFRIAQEALLNSARHAQAQMVLIEFEQQGQGGRLRIQDDGIGFAPGRLRRRGDRQGRGLVSMRERAEFAGGRFSLKAAPGKGTRIEVEIL